MSSRFYPLDVRGARGCHAAARAIAPRSLVRGDRHCAPFIAGITGITDILVTRLAISLRFGVSRCFMFVRASGRAPHAIARASMLAAPQRFTPKYWSMSPMPGRFQE
jgi:hypothetical protein